MLWPNLTTESNTTIEDKQCNILSDALFRPLDLFKTELFTGEENERQATNENIRLNNLSATSIQIDDSVKKSLINDYNSDPAFAEHVADQSSLSRLARACYTKMGNCACLSANCDKLLCTTRTIA
jgi:hypothetical protein